MEAAGVLVSSVVGSGEGGEVQEDKVASRTATAATVTDARRTGREFRSLLIAGAVIVVATTIVHIITIIISYNSRIITVIIS